MKKHIYLIRHGQTTYNHLRKHQYLAVPLSELGHAQAKRLAEGMANLQFDTLISSDIARARQTAEHIATVTKKEIIFEPLFRELDRPQAIVGKNFFSLKSILVFALLYLRSGNPTWRYDTEENFSEFRDRIHRAIEYIEHSDEEALVIVTHRIFIAGFLAALKCKFACSMHAFAWDTLKISAGMENCSITELSYDSEAKEKWRVVRVGDNSIVAGI